MQMRWTASADLSLSDCLDAETERRCSVSRKGKKTAHIVCDAMPLNEMSHHIRSACTDGWASERGRDGDGRPSLILFIERTEPD